ncbi:Uncharacterised protein [Klebsiella michiganensis]|uniref:Uncharacterized protein n=1 Tax=Klebsiella michiganensis TaxID=1134687 RepID=A0A7H4N0F7_9ENTR|nr:Uncharacterised protein [Klebsiella michiganensis]
MKQDINIDALMADAWLTVTELRFGARLADGEGDPPVATLCRSY